MRKRSAADSPCSCDDAEGYVLQRRRLQTAAFILLAIESIAAGKSKPESYEKAGLEKTFHDDARVLAAANTAENRAKLKPLI